MGRRRRRGAFSDNKNSKSKLYLAIFIILVALIVLLGTKDIDNKSDKISTDITDQIKS